MENERIIKQLHCEHKDYHKLKFKYSYGYVCKDCAFIWGRNRNDLLKEAVKDG